MASHPLINTYLQQLEHRIQARRDLPDVLDELADHHAETSARLQASGMSQHEAVKMAVEALGNIDVVAEHLTCGFERQFAVPTRYTRFGGWVAGASGLAWLVMLAAWWTSLRLEHLSGWTVTSETAYIVGAVALWAGVLCNTVVVTALRRRLGAIGWAGIVAVIGAAAATIASVFGWLVVVWTPLLAVSAIATGVSCIHNERVPRAPLLTFGASWTTSAAALLIDRAAVVTISMQRDMTWLTLGGTMAIVSCLVISRWLRREYPVPPGVASHA